MIHVIGTKKAALLGFLGLLNAVLGASVYLYFIPQSGRLEAELQGMKAQVVAKRADTDRLIQEYNTIQEQKSRFENLDASGFFSDQNRFVARRRIEQIQEFTNVMTARYDIGSAKTEENEFVKEADHVLLNSPVKIDIEAMDDVDFYKFIYWVENGFPGHISIVDITVKRNQNVNEALLRQIGNGTPVALVSGTIRFDWHTILPKSEVDSNASGQQGL